MLDQVDSPSSTSVEAGAPKGAPEPKYLRLISPATSFITFLKKHVSKAVVQGAKTIVVEEYEDIPLRFTPAPIAGSPEFANGCACEITEREAKEWGLTLEEIETQIKERGLYGQRFAFDNDNEAAKRIIHQIGATARKEAAVISDALIEGLVNSDLAIRN